MTKDDRDGNDNWERLMGWQYNVIQEKQYDDSVDDKSDDDSNDNDNSMIMV